MFVIDCATIAAIETRHILSFRVPGRLLRCRQGDADQWAEMMHCHRAQGNLPHAIALFEPVRIGGRHALRLSVGGRADAVNVADTAHQRWPFGHDAQVGGIVRRLQPLAQASKLVQGAQMEPTPSQPRHSTGPT